MSPPPTSIDGTEITGATIDGQEVQEITIDGDTVFTSGLSNLPVAFSNLIAWYPFDSAEYGGSNADDVTAIIGGSGDDTAFDGTVDGAIYRSSGGVIDINAGANSGAYEFQQNFNSSPNDAIDLPSQYLTTGTVSVWVNVDTFDSGSLFLLGVNTENFFGFDRDSQTFIVRDRIDHDTTTFAAASNMSTNTWHHLVWSVNGSTIQGWIDNNKTSASGPEGLRFDEIGYPYVGGRVANPRFSLDGHADDLRVYNKVLSDSEVTQIYNNTDP